MMNQQAIATFQMRVMKSLSLVQKELFIGRKRIQRIRLRHTSR